MLKEIDLKREQRLVLTNAPFHLWGEEYFEGGGKPQRFFSLYYIVFIFYSWSVKPKSAYQLPKKLIFLIWQKYKGKLYCLEVLLTIKNGG
ncbi:MAG: hypothetical protein KA522_00855 [Candidatus Saccharicenans sp.]|jgi:hypothetical protein|nr:hypothetical protein [Candidatus Saccharicenans sp.]